MTTLLSEQTEDQAEAGGVVKGVAVGIVTVNKDGSGQARVKVHFPWRANSDESYWARVGMPMTGDGRGIYFLPEVGDEVLCAFDKGDIRFPYVVCCLWNGKHSSPTTNADGKNDIRVIHTRSGHKIKFDDGADGGIDIRTTGGKQVYLNDHKIEITDGGSNVITIDTDGGSITLRAAQGVKIESQKIDIEAGSAMNLKCGGALTLQGSLVRIN